MLQITITVLPEEEKNQTKIDSLIKTELKKINFPLNEFNESTCVLQKRSVDARRGTVKIHLRYALYKKGENESSKIPDWKQCSGKKQVVIVGSGPAGLFGALKLLEYGIKPIIIEQGEETSERKVTIAKISTQGEVNDFSNYCFGEGGAGTFSDGKLYTRSNKRGDISKILSIFNYFGADEKILTDSHPHIGTDRLPKIINSIKDFIRSKGGELYFCTECFSLITKAVGSKKEVIGVKCKNVVSKKEFDLSCDAVLLATGHSSERTYKMIAELAPDALEAKTFAVGVRAEHPRSLIDKIQYHGKPGTEQLGAAEYRFVTQQKERGVYSFCMCPGGFVVPSATGKDQIVVNGMSSAKRNSAWSNAAIVVEVRPEDIPLEFKQKAKNVPAIAGLLWRTELEKLCAKNGNGQKAPAQRITDFINKKISESLPKSSYTPGLVTSRLDLWIPQFIAERISLALQEVNKSMKGYVCEEGILIAIETRTSTPVRILREKETCESPVLKKLFPCGEGAGYSGGIVSSAMDGEKVCESIARMLATS